MWPRRRAMAARPRFHLLPCGWRAIPSSRRLTSTRLKKAQGSSSSDMASDLPPCGQYGTWPYIGRMQGPKVRSRVVSSAASEPTTCTDGGGQGRDRTADLPLFRRTLVPTELPGRKAACASPYLATLTGLEPATSAVTGRRANQLRHRALLSAAPRRRVAVPPTGFEPALPP